MDPALVPPPVTPASPLLALIDSQLDAAHPEFAGGNVATLGGLPVASAHGTETAAVAAAPKNDVGILGVWPGMRALNVPLPEEIRCGDSVTGIGRAIEQGAAVINMSYGSAALCFAEYVQLQLATAKGITLVAAAGNELSDGNPLLFPASLPHVLTVAAVGPDLRPPFFSSASAAVDLAAPGVGILSATPPQFDEDGDPDGYEAVTGTSFSAPMVAAAAAWLRAVKPQLKVDQVASTLRASARDLDRRGWDSATGFGLLSMSRALALRDAGGRPARAQRRHGMGGRPRARSQVTARSGAAAGRSGCARCRQARGPGRRLPHRLPAAREGQGLAQAALRRRRPRRLHPQRHLDGRRRADHRPLAPQRPPQGLARVAQSLQALARRLPRRLHRREHPRARLPLRPQRPARQATLSASLPWVWVAGSAASASPASSRPGPDRELTEGGGGVEAVEAEGAHARIVAGLTDPR